jgi:voltage-gated potassium channel
MLRLFGDAGTVVGNLVKTLAGTGAGAWMAGGATRANLREGGGTMWQHKYFMLLLTLVGVLVWESSARRAVLGRVASDVSVTLVALAVFLVVFKGWRQRTVALVAAGLSTALNWSRYLPVPEGYRMPQTVAHHALMVVFLAFAVAVILTNIFESEGITGDEVLGTVCGYLLAAGMWANAYVVTETLVPGSFSPSPELKVFFSAHGRAALLNYFSLVTLTTMGYGDITPARTPATVLAVLEAVFGQFYIAVVVAQLVGMRMTQAFGPKEGRRRGRES